MGEFDRYPPGPLQAVFSKRPFQIQEPEKASIIFLGLDANFSEDLDGELLQEFIDYLTDGVGYWQKQGIHTPMLQKYYKGGGKRYHARFEKLDLKPEHAKDSCFLELLNVCTCGNSTTRNGKKAFYRLLHSSENQSHLKRIKALANDKRKQIYICGRRTENLIREIGERGLFDITEKTSLQASIFPRQSLTSTWKKWASV